MGQLHPNFMISPWEALLQSLPCSFNGANGIPRVVGSHAPGCSLWWRHLRLLRLNETNGNFGWKDSLLLDFNLGSPRRHLVTKRKWKQHSRKKKKKKSKNASCLPSSSPVSSLSAFWLATERWWILFFCSMFVFPLVPERLLTDRLKVLSTAWAIIVSYIELIWNVFKEFTNRELFFCAEFYTSCLKAIWLK